LSAASRLRSVRVIVPVLVVARDLHSFPTRRSSDLEIVPALRPSRVSGAGTGPCAFLSGAAAQRPRLRAEPRDREEGLVADRRAADRKSTRLNSSHVSISYAVFCLKKKTEELAERMA